MTKLETTSLAMSFYITDCKLNGYAGKEKEGGLLGQAVDGSAGTHVCDLESNCTEKR